MKTHGLSPAWPRVAGAPCLLFLLLFFLFRCSESHAVTHPHLLMSKAEIADMKSKIANYTWAGNLYDGTVRANADSALSQSLSPTKNLNILWETGQKLIDLGLVYQISGESKYAQKVRTVLLAHANGWIQGTLAPWAWSSSMYGIRFIWAYDLTYNYGGWTSTDRTLMKRFFTEMAELCVAEPQSYKPTNRWAWTHAQAGAVGYFYGIQEYITYGIDDRGGFKDILENHVKDGFWKEATWYGPNYGMCSMTILAEAALHSSGTNLYNYTSPSGNSIKTMFDRYLDSCFPNGVVAAHGDIGSVKRSGGWPLFEWQENRNGRAKFEIAYKRYEDPDYAWVLRHNTARNGRDVKFWGYLALTHGVPTLPSAPAPAARSGTYPNMGIAMLMAEEGTGYWGSGSLAVFVRFGGICGHAHQDQFGIVLHAFNVLMEPDLFNGWDYGSTRADRLTRWSPHTIAHNTVMVDKKSTGHRDYGLVAFQDFNENIKVLVLISPSGSSVRKSRTLGLTEEYLVDVFELSSGSSHTYDWVAHQYGSLSVPGVELTSYDVGKDVGFGVINKKKPGINWIVDGKHGNTTGPWRAEFREKSTRGLNLLFSEEDSKTVLVGRGPYHVSDDGVISSTRVPLVIVRKTGTSKKFVVLHVPFKGTTPTVASLERISPNGVKISGSSFIDYFFWSDTTSAKTGKKVDAAGIHIEFKGAYAYVRVEKRRITAQKGEITLVRLTG